MPDEYYKILMTRTSMGSWYPPASSTFQDIESVMLRNGVWKMKITYANGMRRWFKLIEHRTPR